VARDLEAVKTAVNEFVTAYDDVDKVLKDLSAYNDQTKKGAVLQGDTATRNIRNHLREIMADSMTGNAFSVLADIGVNFQLGGNLTVDSARLDKALGQDFEAVGNLFARESETATETGFGFRLDEYVDDLLASDGSLAIRTEGINKSIRLIEQKEESLLARMEQIEARYRKQFAALDSLISTMNTTSSFLTQQLASLQANNES